VGRLLELSKCVYQLNWPKGCASPSTPHIYSLLTNIVVGACGLSTWSPEISYDQQRILTRAYIMKIQRSKIDLSKSPMALSAVLLVVQPLEISGGHPELGLHRN